MTLSLKQEIEVWVEALNHYDKNEFEMALRVFDNISDTSKIWFNCGVIHATIGEHEKAVECYQRAISCDQYLAVAYFQQGVSNFLVGDFEEALANFNDTLLFLRGNRFIDYEQLGLKFKLYSCEVLFNRGLCYMYLQQDKPGMQDFQYAVKEKMTPDHDVIDEAIREQAAGYTVFSIPVGVVYRPNEAKVKNLKTKDYLGKARLIATATANTSTGFQGAELRQQQILESSARDDRPPENISYAATNLVQRNLSSRTRDQSAPPAMGRNMFPPTPPPEGEKPRTSIPSFGSPPPRALPVRSPPTHKSSSSMSNLAPVSNHDIRPALVGRAHTTSSEITPPLSVDSSSSSYSSQDRPRLGTARTASEPRGPQSRRHIVERNASTGGHNRGPSSLLFRETTNTQLEYMPEEDTVADVYNMYRSSGKRDKKHRSKEQQQYLDEEDEYINSSPDELTTTRRSHSRGPSVSSNASNSRRPEMRKIRVKVHAHEDTRYIMLNAPHIEYDDFESRIREKFSIRGKLRMKMRDFDDESGHMITMADQDDLEVLLNHVRTISRQERSEMGKMEVWVQEL